MEDFNNDLRLAGFFYNMNDEGVLDSAIELTRFAVEATPPFDQARQARHLCLRGMLFGFRYERSMELDDKNNEVDAHEIALALTPPEGPVYATYLNNVLMSISSRYFRTRTREDLDRLIDLYEINLAAKLGNYKQPKWLYQFSKLLQERFDQSEVIEDLNRAVDIINTAMTAIPSENNGDQSAYFSVLVPLLEKRFALTQTIGDLDRLVEIYETTLVTTPTHPIVATLLHRIGSLLKERFDRTHSMEDLNRSVTAMDRAIESLSPDEHSHRAELLTKINALLRIRYEDQKALADLHRGIKTLENALESEPDQSHRNVWLEGLADWAIKRFLLTESLEYLDNAIKFSNMAIESLPGSSDGPDRSMYLFNHGELLSMKFNVTGEPRYLSRAIQIAEKNLETMPFNCEIRNSVLTGFASLLMTRYLTTGATEDLQRAIKTTETIVHDSGLDNIGQAIQLGNLALMLENQFLRTGSMDDLNGAFGIIKSALKIMPPNNPGQPSLLMVLSGILCYLFFRTKKIEDLNSSIETIEAALATTNLRHSSRYMTLLNLALILNVRFDETKAIEDLYRAIKVLEEVLKSIPEGHHRRPWILNSLASSYSRLFEQIKEIQHLNLSIDLHKLSLEAAASGQPEITDWSLAASSALLMRYAETGESNDYEQALEISKEGWKNRNGNPTKRLSCARKASYLLAKKLRWEEANSVSEEAVPLFTSLSPRSLKNADKEYMLAQFSNMASRFAAIALNAGEDVIYAFELLELGRGVIAGLLLEMRTDVSDLEEEYPQLTKEFIALRDELDTPSNELAILTSNDLLRPGQKLRGRLEVDEQFNEVIARIRALPKFERFLLPPTEDEVRSAASQGPIVVINMSIYRCDAFLIESHQIRVLPLPRLTESETEEKARQLRSFGITSSTLEWLWDVVTCPVLEALGFKEKPSDNNWPHVWWIPTGALTHLPLHASGYHSEGSSNTVLDRVMSSYISSVKALIYSRRNNARGQTRRQTNQLYDNRSGKPSNTRALLIAMRETPGLSTNSVLPYAAKEVEMLDSLCPSLNWEPTQPARCRKEVLEHMRTSKIFHFAGHGQSDPSNPAQSSLLLEDWRESPLTVGDLRDHKLQENSPFLGYLSACSTGMNKADKLLDEGIHLVSALQLAGFRHVVGTLWEVSDRHCVDVAKILYETIRDEGMTDEAVYRGLHFAVTALRDRAVGMRKPASQSEVLEKEEETKKNEKASQVVVDTTGFVRSEDGEGSDNKKRMGRDAKLISAGKQRVEQEDPRYWAPYIHFGV